jgi:predicted DNA-binding transcriptional regulator AlpA
MDRASLEELRSFDQLPDVALVRLPVVCALLSVSGSTVWRWCRAGKLPQPAHVGNVTFWNVGDLRQAISAAFLGGAAQRGCTDVPRL